MPVPQWLINLFISYRCIKIFPIPALTGDGLILAFLALEIIKSPKDGNSTNKNGTSIGLCCASLHKVLSNPS